MKSHKVDIIIGIPTYNEADSISNTVSKIDRALSKYFPQFDAYIVNMDSQSVDGTGRAFLVTKTKTKKIFISTNERPRGKGRNVFAFIKIANKLDATYMAIIDADVSTITEEWIKSLLTPIVSEGVDFVAPIYSRNRYEGNTTNHFCFPLLYAWFGRRLSQPIGGDFAFNGRFARYIRKQRKTKNVLFYGIDIFLSVHAMGGGFKIKEVYLGRKIHKTSFDKIVPMFQQVAASMLFVLPIYKHKNLIHQQNDQWRKKQRIDEFIRKPQHNKIVTLRREALRILERTNPKAIRRYTGLRSWELYEIQQQRFAIFVKQWVKILTRVAKYITEHSINEATADGIAKTISPFFFFRVLGYFEELNRLKNTRAIGMLILRQAQELRHSVGNKRHP